MTQQSMTCVHHIFVFRGQSTVHRSHRRLAKVHIRGRYHVHRLVGIAGRILAFIGRGRLRFTSVERCITVDSHRSLAKEPSTNTRTVNSRFSASNSCMEIDHISTHVHHFRLQREVPCVKRRNLNRVRISQPQQIPPYPLRRRDLPPSTPPLQGHRRKGCGSLFGQPVYINDLRDTASYLVQLIPGLKLGVPVIRADG